MGDRGPEVLRRPSARTFADAEDRRSGSRLHGVLRPDLEGRERRFASGVRRGPRRDCTARRAMGRSVGDRLDGASTKPGGAARVLVAHASVHTFLDVIPSELVVYNPMGLRITYLQADRALVTEAPT